jgi:hypothetical protein
MKVAEVITSLILACVACQSELARAELAQSFLHFRGSDNIIGHAIERANQYLGRTEKSVQDKASASDVLGQLAALPLDELYTLKAWPNLCDADMVRCGVLTADRVRPFVDMELDRRKAELDYRDKQNSFFLSLGSLVISGCALLVSGFAAFRKPSPRGAVGT